MADVKIVRLTTGEELIAKVSDAGNSMIKLTDPLLIIPMQEGKLTFATWLPYNSDKFVDVKKDSVMFLINPVSEMSNQYNQATGSVVVPDKKIII